MKDFCGWRQGLQPDLQCCSIFQRRLERQWCPRHRWIYCRALHTGDAPCPKCRPLALSLLLLLLLLWLWLWLLLLLPLQLFSQSCSSQKPSRFSNHRGKHTVNTDVPCAPGAKPRYLRWVLPLVVKKPGI